MSWTSTPARSGASRWAGDEYVNSSDEKTSVQARCRCHPTLTPGRVRVMRVNHEYGRGGALAYLAAYDVHQAKVFGRCEPRPGIMPWSSRRETRISCRVCRRKDEAVEDLAWFCSSFVIPAPGRAVTGR